MGFFGFFFLEASSGVGDVLVVESKKHLLVALRSDFMENKPQELFFPAQSVCAVDAPPARNAGTLSVPLEQNEVNS